MRVVEPHEFKNVKHPKEKRKGRNGLRAILVVVLFVYVVMSLLRPLPPVTTTSVALASSQTKPVQIAWPTYGQAAVGAVGYGTLGTQGEVKALPTASVAKVMTALAVLTKKPLAIGEQGPVITITQDDVDEYAQTIALDGSNVPVVVGEEITQYQALQALLLPSANNMAYTLAKWAYGSEAEYLLFVNNFAKSLGMTNTTFDDTSGYSSKTVSTAQDLVKLAVNAMDNPVIAEIVAQPEATIPVAGKIYNVNGLLGQDGIVGVKTGNTEQAGGCFMAAAVKEIEGKKVTAVSVIMGAPNLSFALKDSVPLVNSVFNGFSVAILVKSGQTVGQYAAPWGQTTDLVAKSAVSGLVWSGESVSPVMELDSSVTAPLTSGQVVGMVKAEFGRDISKADVVSKDPIGSPGILWRLKPDFIR